MPRTYRKICLTCLKEFESTGSKDCPHCGSDRWNFLNARGGVMVPYRELLKGRPGPRGEVMVDRDLSDRRMADLVAKYHPESVA